MAHQQELHVYGPEQSYYVCSKCETHIALEQEKVFEDTVSRFIYFRDCDNYDLDGLLESNIGEANDTTLGIIICHVCQCELGLVFLADIDEFFEFRQGVKLIYMDALRFWDGHGLRGLRDIINVPAPLAPLQLPLYELPPSLAEDMLAEPPQPSSSSSSSSSSSQ